MYRNPPRIVLILAILFSAFTAFSTTDTVTTSNNAGAGSLRDIVSSSGSGDTIVFHSSTNGNKIRLSSQITLDKDLVIIGNGASITIIDAQDNDRIFTVSAGVVVELREMKIQNGSKVAIGGGILNHGTLSICNSGINSNRAKSFVDEHVEGGGIYNMEGLLMIENCNINDNEVSTYSYSFTWSSKGGAIYNNNGQVFIKASFLRNNSVFSAWGYARGGAIYSTGSSASVEIDNSSLLNNTVSTYERVVSGGGIHNYQGFVSINASTIGNNEAKVNAFAYATGGGVYSEEGSVVVDSSFISGNKANSSHQGSARGGGVTSLDGSLLISSSEVHNNSAASRQNSQGGGIYSKGSSAILQLMGSSIYGNVATFQFYDDACSSYGGGIYNSSSQAVISNTTIDGNSTLAGEWGWGGGIYNGGATLTLDSVIIINNLNKAYNDQAYGGGIYNTGPLTYMTGTVKDNDAQSYGHRGYGGAIFNKTVNASTVLHSVQMKGNRAIGARGGDGGAICNLDANLSIQSCEIVLNEARGSYDITKGGGIYNKAGSITIDNSSIRNNLSFNHSKSGKGGGIFNEGANASITATDCSIRTNEAYSEKSTALGGGIYNEGASALLTLQEDSLKSNSAYSKQSAAHGGGLYVKSGQVTVDHSWILSNQAESYDSKSYGGGISNAGGVVDLEYSELAGNISTSRYQPSYGGGLYIGGGTTLVKWCHIRTNTVSALNVVYGGAIYQNSGTTLLKESTLYGNKATARFQYAYGGGIYHKGGTMDIKISTISGNECDADFNSFGGGIIMLDGFVSLESTTITKNAAKEYYGTRGHGGGIYKDGSGSGTLTLLNVVVWGNLGYDFYGNNPDYMGDPIDFIDYSLVKGIDFTGMGTGNLDGTLPTSDPKFESLADNGGPTKTHALLCGSGVFNRADPACIDLDQRGESIFDGIRDMGAYEAQTILLDTDGDGVCDVDDEDDDNDGVPDTDDNDPFDPFSCEDLDGDGCDDCVLGTDGFGPSPDFDPMNDGQDTDGDGLCNDGDPDDDNDGVMDAIDPAPLDPDICGDVDGDSCDDCSVGTDDFGPLADNLPSNDGPDTDGDGLCDAGDPDDDNDGVPDANDPFPLDPDLCGDADGDTCDDCVVGTDDFGPLADNIPANDGTDTDGDGLCDFGDPDDDNDGVPDVEDPEPLNPDLCGDSDGDSCDDCAIGTDDFGPLPDNDPANDGTDGDQDGWCAITDCEDDNPDVNPGTPEICNDVDENCDGQLGEPDVGSYCCGFGTDSTIYIQQVQAPMNGMISESGYDQGYGDHTDHVLSVNPYYPYLYLILYPGGDLGLRHWQAFADWNQDETFDAGEKVLDYCSWGPFGQFIPVPSGFGGETRLRIVMASHPAGCNSSDIPSDACGEIGVGEVEDYTIGMPVAFQSKPQPQAQIQVFPNPFDDEFFLVYNLDPGLKLKLKLKLKLQLFNSQGQLIRTEKATTNGEPIRIDASGLPAGTYYLRVNTGDQVIVKTILKQ